MFQILIADDEPNIREGVRQFITRRCPEWQVVGAARDGREALEMAERFLPDCIMTDITMPHVNGLEFLEKIKGELPDAKLLILSGYDDFEYAVQGMRLGVSDYLLKPLDTELLIQRLDAFAAELTQRQQQWQDRGEQMQQRLEPGQKNRGAMGGCPLCKRKGEAMTNLQIQNPISELLQKRGQNREMGLYSCCSANEYVIRAALRRAKDRDTVVLVEATANQVNQNGGYTGMTPVAFRAFLNRLAEEENFPIDKLLCGGDHLGPLTWTHLPEAEAMKNAGELIRSYVLAGFSKIHIDTSMRLADDAPNERLSDVVIAHRGAQLCRIAEEAFAQYSAWHPEAPAPVYIIGSEVPIPGGAQENEDSVTVTAPEDCEATLSTFRAAFCSNHLEAAWERVVAIVVQPGVEFADESVIEYDRTAAHSLTEHLKRHPNLVFEGHSTDYQPRQCLRKMVEDGIAILKVGPALTFALREGLFALEQIERELYGMMDFPCSHFREILEQVMLEDQGQWTKYYHGSMPEKRYARAFSYSDRARYYLTNSKVQGALRLLLDNLNTAGIPMALISQYMPVQYARVHAGILPPKAEDLLMDRVGDCIDDYLYAVLRD